jgi:hypothetical protein
VIGRWYAKVVAAERILPSAASLRLSLLPPCLVRSGRAQSATLDRDSVRAFLSDVLLTLQRAGCLTARSIASCRRIWPRLGSRRDGTRAAADYVLATALTGDEVNAARHAEPGRRAWARNDFTWASSRCRSPTCGRLRMILHGRDVIELGCGTAYLSAWLARRGARG